MFASSLKDESRWICNANVKPHETLRVRNETTPNMPTATIPAQGQRKQRSTLSQMVRNFGPSRDDTATSRRRADRVQGAQRVTMLVLWGYAAQRRIQALLLLVHHTPLTSIHEISQATNVGNQRHIPWLQTRKADAASWAPPFTGQFRTALQKPNEIFGASIFVQIQPPWPSSSPRMRPPLR